MAAQDVCEHHDQRTRDLEQIFRVVSRHSGQWRVLLVVLAVFGSALLYMNQRTQNAVDTIESAVVRIELTYSNYVASHTVESSQGFRMIRHNERCIASHGEKHDDWEARISLLER